MHNLQKYQFVFGVGLLVSFFIPWGTAFPLADSGYGIALQFGGHSSILLLIPIRAAELFFKNIRRRYSKLFRLTIAILTFIVYFLFISYSGVGSILFLIPVMASELLIRVLMGEDARMWCAIYGLTTLCILGFGTIYLAGEEMKYLELFQSWSIGFYASIVLGILMLFYGTQAVVWPSFKDKLRDVNSE